MVNEKISVATYSLRSSLKDPNISFKGIADYLNNHGVQNVEINNMFVKPDSIDDTAKIFTDQGIKPILLTCDGNNFFQKKESDRKKQFDWMKVWLDAAHKISVPMVRANMGHGFGFLKKTDTVENLVGTFRPILEYAEQLGISFVFENHGGKSSDVDFQMAVKNAFPSKKMGFLLDTGNYKPKDLVYENILKLKDSILIVHAKTYDFDQNGEETLLNFNKIIQNLKSVGFKGYYSVEFEGSTQSDIEGTTKTIALLDKYI